MIEFRHKFNSGQKFPGHCAIKVRSLQIGTSFSVNSEKEFLNLILNPTQKVIADFQVGSRDLNSHHSTLTGPMWKKGEKETL